MSKFLQSLVTDQKKRTNEKIEHNGKVFLFTGIDAFTYQKVSREAISEAEIEMEKTGNPDWKNQPGTKQGVNKWDEELSALADSIATLYLIAQALKQENGAPIWETPEEKSMFCDYLKLEISFLSRCQALLAKKLMASVNSATPKPTKKQPKVK